MVTGVLQVDWGSWASKQEGPAEREEGRNEEDDEGNGPGKVGGPKQGPKEFDGDDEGGDGEEHDEDGGQDDGDEEEEEQQHYGGDDGDGEDDGDGDGEEEHDEDGDGEKQCWLDGVLGRIDRHQAGEAQYAQGHLQQVFLHQDLFEVAISIFESQCGWVESPTWYHSIPTIFWLPPCRQTQQSRTRDCAGSLCR